MTEASRTANKITWLLSVLMGGLLVWLLTGCANPDLFPKPSPPVATSSTEIRTVADFDKPLSRYGRWEIVGAYGRCWIPDHLNPTWRPYSNGNWQNTAAGWYWTGNEPWAWATYHYGRWGISSRFGWYWMPDTRWATAWVTWYEGGGYVGWAPLSPLSRSGRGGTIRADAQALAPRAFVFVEERNFLDPVRPATVVPTTATIIRKTTNITRIHVINHIVINEGPPATFIQQASGQKIQVFPVRELRDKEEAAIAGEDPPPTLGRNDQ